MKNYAKVVQAVQYLGSVDVLKEILVKEDVILDNDKTTVILFKESGKPEAGYWNLKETDFVIKEGNTISVYKEARFLAEYDEVLVEDVDKEIHVAGMVPDVSKIEVMDVEVVKVKKNVASQVVDKSKKE